MTIFKNSTQSHEHSLQILNLLYEYDDFMDSVKVITDMGCGAGLDTHWWATLNNREDPPKPHNYLCYAVDQATDGIDKSARHLKNVKVIPKNFEQTVLPRLADVIWCHDAFQYALNPLNTLAVWNAQMNTDGMLVMCVPQSQSHEYNRFKSRSYSGCYHNYTLLNLMYMLAVNGFDCRDGFFLKKQNDPWINVAVYKNEVPMDPANTTWWDLAERKLIPDSVINCLNKYGFVKQEEIVVRWLDKDYYRVKD